jgi:DNA-directed RNA polymerase subunit RPC12/RpoP
VAYVVIALGFAFAGGIVGKLKGSSFFLWFLISGVLPFIGLIAALLYRSDRDELRRQCPSCGSIVMLHDAVCTRCGAELEYPDVVLAPESASPPPRAS